MRNAPREDQETQRARRFRVGQRAIVRRASVSMEGVSARSLTERRNGKQEKAKTET